MKARAVQFINCWASEIRGKKNITTRVVHKSICANLSDHYQADGITGGNCRTTSGWHCALFNRWLMHRIDLVCVYIKIIIGLHCTINVRFIFT